MVEEENIITPEEFRDIEKREKEKEEKKFTLFGRKKNEKKDLPPLGSRDAEKEPLVDLTLKLERLLGRVEILENNRSEVNERIANLSERIGELRSTLVELDKNYSELTGKFGTVYDIAKELKPEKILKNLEKKEAEIEKNNAKIESLEDKLKILSSKFKDLSNAIEQIKGLKDVVSIADELNKKIKIVEDLKNKTERNAGTVETLFYELKENLNKLQNNIDKIETNEETLKELLRTVDRLSLKLNETAQKKELEKVNKELEEKLSELKFDTESKFSDLIEVIKGTNKKTGGLTMTELNKEVEKIKQFFDRRMETLKREQGGKLAGVDYTYLDNKIKDYEEKIKKQLDLEKENLNKRFADLEMKLLGLSKKIDSKIENKLNMEKTKKTIPPGERLTAQINYAKPRYIYKPVRINQEESKKTDKVFELINRIQRLINSGNYNEAREQYIHLLSEYEKQNESNPRILMKIAEFHSRLRH